MSDLTTKWCWWNAQDEQFHVCETEEECHAEAQDEIDCNYEAGDELEYNVARVAHPMDSLGMEWIAKHIGNDIEENICCWCDDETGAEEPSIELTQEDKDTLGKVVAAFVREKASVGWWTADKKTTAKHSYESGSNDEGGICPTCSGSGEGMHEGTTCHACKGKGVA